MQCPWAFDPTDGKGDSCPMDYLVKNLRHIVANPHIYRGQLAAGEGAGVTQSAISKIITGKTKEPGYRTVAGLAKHFGLSIDDLVSRDIEVNGVSQPSQPERLDGETMSQAFDLLYLIADHRQDDPRFSRLTWHMVQVAAKAIQRAEAGASQRAVIAEILAEIK